MQTLTLPELIEREGIPTDAPIFRFRRENSKGIIEFDMHKEKATSHFMNPEDVIKELESLQVRLGRKTNSVKIIRSLRQTR